MGDSYVGRAHFRGSAIVRRGRNQSGGIVSNGLICAFNTPENRISHDVFRYQLQDPDDRVATTNAQPPA